MTPLNPKERLAEIHGPRSMPSRSLREKFLIVVAPYFGSRNTERRQAWCWGAVMLLLLVLESAVLVAFSYTQKHFSTSMSKKDEAGFYGGIRGYVSILTFAAPLFAASKFTQSRLALSWREWLTMYLCTSYFKDRAYYLLKIGGGKSVGRGASSRSVGGGEEDQGGALDNPGSVIDNPDQRIGEDIASFTYNCVDVLVEVVGEMLKVISFVGVLMSISRQLTLFVVGYAALGTVMSTVLFGAKLKHLNFEGAKREANLRFGLVRVREHAEEIAFYSGEAREAAAAATLLAEVMSNAKALLKTTFCLDCFNNSFSWFTTVLPYLVVAHRYFAGEVDYGTISQTAMAMRVVQRGLSVVVTKMAVLTRLAAETERLHFLMAVLRDQGSASDGGGNSSSDKSGGSGGKDKSGGGSETEGEDDEDDNGVVIADGGVGKSGGNYAAVAMEEPMAQPAGKASAVVPPVDARQANLNDVLGFITYTTMASDGRNDAGSGDGGVSSGAPLAAQMPPSAPVLAIWGLCLRTPDLKELICDGLSLEVWTGQSLLIFGRSGCGKSSLLRALAGLWTTGRGHISAPPPRDVLFLPQKAYMPLGSLREQLSFPHGSEDKNVGGDGGGGGGGGGGGDARLLEALEAVQLGYVGRRCGGLGAVRDWEDELSVGEQQRLAFARLLVCRPRLAVLDEATSALDEENESRLYSRVQAEAQAVVSVGHRSSLFKYHTHVLKHHEGGGNGGWSLVTMADFLKRRGAAVGGL